LFADLDGAEALYKHYYRMFYGFKELMSDKDQRRMSWLTCKAGSTAYKIICNKAGLPEEYDDDAPIKAKAFQGAFVSVPYVDYVE
jgi:hypothetical protein